MNNWNRMFKPIVVLCVICVVITGALAATNSVTAPIIEEATRLAQEQARQELLPEASGFTKVEDVSVENVSDVYTADNGVGTVITCSGKGYSSTITVMVAFTPDGTIKQIKVTSQGETQGVGTKVTTQPTAFWDQFAGKAAQTLTLGVDVDKITGASISSRAVTNAVNAAIDAYNEISGKAGV